jgi:hypothetical protein
MRPHKRSEMTSNICIFAASLLTLTLSACGNGIGTAMGAIGAKSMMVPLGHIVVTRAADTLFPSQAERDRGAARWMTVGKVTLRSSTPGVFCTRLSGSGPTLDFP